jgi:hypothetical protein
MGARNNQRKMAQFTGLDKPVYYSNLEDIITDYNLGADGGIGIPFLGIARYIYLVNDASDVTALGGATNNVYVTAQAAYDAANTLQVLLGGTNKVVVVVGNTVAATVGNIILTANWNANVIFSGINSNVSAIGTITSTTFSIVATFINITTGNITTTTGGAITLTLKNSVTGNLTTSTATAVTTGAITFSNSYESTVGTIIATSSLGGISLLTYSNCNHIITGNISKTQTSAIASFSVGALVMTNCIGCTFGSYTATMAFATSAGTVGGLNINNTNQETLFTGAIEISAFTNVTDATSNTAVSNIILNNATINSTFRVNGRGTSSNYLRTGGVITNVNIQSCTFNGANNKMVWNATSPALTTAVFIMRNCRFTSSINSSGLNMLSYNVQFTTYEIVDSTIIDFGVGFWVNNSLSPVPLLNGTNPLKFSNILHGNVFIELIAGVALVFDDVVFDNLNVDNVTFTVFAGDASFIASNINTPVMEINDDGGSVVKRSTILSSNADITMAFGAISLNVRESSLIFSIIASSSDVVAYGSTLDYYNTGATTISGTLTTCTVIRQNTSTLTATLNNSFDESLA